MTNINLSVGVEVSSIRLSIPDKRAGRRTFFGRLKLGKYWAFIMRWDTDRAPDNRFKSSDGVMGWTWGFRH